VPNVVDLEHYPLLNLAVRSSGTDKAAISVLVVDNVTGFSAWYNYAFGGTNWDPVPGIPYTWINTGTALTSSPGYRLSGQDLWSNVRAAFPAMGMDQSLTMIRLLGSSGASGILYYDAVSFTARSATIVSDTMPSWSANGGNASANTTDVGTGTTSIQIAPTSVALSPNCATTGCMATFWGRTNPFVSWQWKKVGGSTVAIVFHLRDQRSSITGDIAYYAGPAPPSAGIAACPGSTEQCVIQVSPSLPTEWTTVQRNVLEDGRQLRNFYNDNLLGSNPSAPPGQGPTPDDLDITGYQLIAFDGSHALFDQLVDRSATAPGTPSAVYEDDWQVTYPDRVVHRLNMDGLLEEVRDRDGNALTLDWTYDYGPGMFGAPAYNLTAIRAPGDGMPLSSGTAQREIAVTRSAPSGFTQVTFTEQVGSTSSSTGRRADFHVATTTGGTWGIGDLVKVSPARNNASTCGARPNGCAEFTYSDTSHHRLALVADPRWDGSTSGTNDMRLEIMYDGSFRAQQIIDRSNGSVARLFVNTYDTGTGGGYRRVVYRDAAQRGQPPSVAAARFRHVSRSLSTAPLVTYAPKP
jgi:hypothetical protein